MHARLLIAGTLLLSPLVLISGCDSAGSGPADPSIAHHLRLNISGDPLLVRKFTLLLRAELVGTDVALSDGPGADIVLRGSINNETETADYGILAIRQQLTWKGETKTVGFCPKIWRDFDSALKETTPVTVGQADQIAQQLKAAFPQATFVFVSPASRFDAPKDFPSALKTAMEGQGMIESTDLPDSVRDLITAELIRSSVAQTRVKYDLKMTGTGSDFDQSGSGSGGYDNEPAYPVYCGDSKVPTFGASDILASVALQVAHSFKISPSR